MEQASAIVDSNSGEAWGERKGVLGSRSKAECAANLIPIF